MGNDKIIKEMPVSLQDWKRLQRCSINLRIFIHNNPNCKLENIYNNINDLTLKMHKTLWPDKPGYLIVRPGEFKILDLNGK
jgi:hypothetical protein